MKAKLQSAWITQNTGRVSYDRKGTWTKTSRISDKKNALQFRPWKIAAFCTVAARSQPRAHKTAFRRFVIMKRKLWRVERSLLRSHRDCRTGNIWSGLPQNSVCSWSRLSRKCRTLRPSAILILLLSVSLSSVEDFFDVGCVQLRSNKQFKFSLLFHAGYFHWK